MKKEKIKNCKRISIIGPTGSGKSTLAKKLGKTLDLPVCHIDCVHHKPNGETENKEVTTEKIKSISQTDKWIIEGNYKGTLENRFLRSEAIIFLNFSIEFCEESIRNRYERQNRIGLPDYFKETKEGMEELISFNLKEKYRIILNENIKPLVTKHSKKVVEFTTREQVNDFLKNYL